MWKATLGSVLMIGTLFMTACEREQRTFRPQAPVLSSPAESIQVSQLRPGGETGPSLPTPTAYQETAAAISNGQGLFKKNNCTGCHGSNGGGSIGPPLIDNNWIYGSQPANIYVSLMDGRPNGMPSWRGKLTDQQAWQIVAYLRALNGLVAPELAIRQQPDITPQQRGAKPGEITGTTGEPSRR